MEMYATICSVEEMEKAFDSSPKRSRADILGEPDCFDQSDSVENEETRPEEEAAGKNVVVLCEVCKENNCACRLRDKVLKALENNPWKELPICCREDCQWVLQFGCRICPCGAPVLTVEKSILREAKGSPKFVPVPILKTTVSNGGVCKDLEGIVNSSLPEEVQAELLKANGKSFSLQKLKPDVWLVVRKDARLIPYQHAKDRHAHDASLVQPTGNRSVDGKVALNIEPVAKYAVEVGFANLIRLAFSPDPILGWILPDTDAVEKLVSFFRCCGKLSLAFACSEFQRSPTIRKVLLYGMTLFCGTEHDAANATAIVKEAVGGRQRVRLAQPVGPYDQIDALFLTVYRYNVDNVHTEPASRQFMAFQLAQYERTRRFFNEKRVDVKGLRGTWCDPTPYFKAALQEADILAARRNEFALRMEHKLMMSLAFYQTRSAPSNVETRKKEYVALAGMFGASSHRIGSHICMALSRKCDSQQLAALKHFEKVFQQWCEDRYVEEEGRSILEALAKPFEKKRERKRQRRRK
jgi:hypothetical protein